MGYMNVRTHPGQKIRFANPNAGYDFDQQQAAKLLKLNEIYTISRTDVGRSHTSVWLKEIPGVGFNSVLFDNVPTVA